MSSLFIGQEGDLFLFYRLVIYMASQTNVGCEICGSLLHDYEKHQRMNQSSRGFGGDGGISRHYTRKRRRKEKKVIK